MKSRIILLPIALAGYVQAHTQNPLQKLEFMVVQDAYADVEPGGHFLGSAHTLSHYRSAFYEAPLSDSNSVEQWEEQGSKDAARRAYERWNRLLDEYEAPALDPAVRESLDDYVARRKAALPDAWY